MTVTMQEALKLPSLVVTVIVVVPFLSGVTTPSFTVATVLSLLDQVTFLFVAVSGEKIGVSVKVPSPVPMLAVSLSSVMPVKRTVSYADFSWNYIKIYIVFIDVADITLCIKDSNGYITEF